MKRLAVISLLTVLALSLTSCTEENLVTSSDTSALPSSNLSSAAEQASETVSSERYEPDVSSKSSSKVPPSSHSASSSKVSSAPPPKEEVSVLIPPSFTVKQIAARLEKNGVCKEKDFLRAVNEGDFSSFSLVKGIKNTSKRCYKLEGYFYPDTYRFYKNSDPEDVIRKILQNTEKKIAGKYQYSGMTTDEIITLASLIEEESGGGSSRKNVSSVIHNRLKKGMKLQLDATVHYLNSLDPADTEKYRFYYNTYNKPGYSCPGLPAGPICSPSAASLDAAVHPNKTDYLYFSTKGNEYIFQTEEEYIAAQQKPSSSAQSADAAGEEED